MSWPTVPPGEESEPRPEGCVHLAVYRGTCVDCLDDVAWPDLSTVGALEARTRRALARVRLQLRARGTARPWGSS